MSLYDLKHSELFWELELDTRCLVAWSSTKIVVSFRGTASMRNAVADMQVSQTAIDSQDRQVKQRHHLSKANPRRQWMNIRHT